MTDEIPTLEAESDAFLEPGVRYYLFLGFAGLIALWLALMEKFGLLALVPVLVGAFGMVGYLVPPRMGALSRALRKPRAMMPGLVMISIALFEILFFDTLRRPSSAVLQLDHLLIAPALLAYMASQYRLFSLGNAAVPPDARPRPDRLGGDEPDPRPTRLVKPTELYWLGGILIGCVIAGQLLWWMIAGERRIAEPDEPERLRIPITWWRLIMFVWVVGVGTFVLTGLFRVLRAYRQSADEARLALQEALWSETRGEHRRSARWMAWARRRVKQQRENPS